MSAGHRHTWADARGAVALLLAGAGVFFAALGLVGCASSTPRSAVDAYFVAVNDHAPDVIEQARKMVVQRVVGLQQQRTLLRADIDIATGTATPADKEKLASLRAQLRAATEGLEHARARLVWVQALDPGSLQIVHVVEHIRLPSRVSANAASTPLNPEPVASMPGSDTDRGPIVGPEDVAALPPGTVRVVDVVVSGQALEARADPDEPGGLQVRLVDIPEGIDKWWLTVVLDAEGAWHVIDVTTPSIHSLDAARDAARDAREEAGSEPDHVDRHERADPPAATANNADAGQLSSRWIEGADGTREAARPWAPDRGGSGPPPVPWSPR